MYFCDIYGILRFMKQKIIAIFRIKDDIAHINNIAQPFKAIFSFGN